MLLKERIEAFVKQADEITAKHWGDAKLTYARPPEHTVEYGSKWAKVFTMREAEGCRHEKGSIYAFIALVDMQTSTLGTVKAGDIHKAASYKLPAKHKRGSVFDEGFNNCLTPYGVAYLR